MLKNKMRRLAAILIAGGMMMAMAGSVRLGWRTTQAKSRPAPSTIGTTQSVKDGAGIAELMPHDSQLTSHLNPDGTLREGSTGSFKVTGYRMALTPDGAPRFLPASACLGWDSQFGLVNGPNSEVFAMAVVGNSLYIGGSFIAVGQVPANRIARYDLQTGVWSAVGSNGGNGVNENVTSLAVIGTSLYVGGFFTEANLEGTVVPVNRIARYETTTGSWSALGTGQGNGVDDLVFDLAAIGGDLYLGGSFATANYSSLVGAGSPGIVARGLARFNTVSGEWSAVGVGGGSGVDGVVLVLAGVGTDLYVGGRFMTANIGGPVVSASNIIRFSTVDSTWRPLGAAEANGVDNEVRALAVLEGNIYVGGRFRMAGSGTAAVVTNYLARYSPATNGWSGLGNGGGNGVNADVYSLAVMGTDLVAGGDFTSANVGGGSFAANRIVRFSPATGAWSLIGAGATGKSLAGSVYRLFAIGADLYLGGNFALANTDSSTIFANNLVRYREADSAWGTLVSSNGNGANSEVYSLARIGRTVYIGGRFTSIGGIAANHIVRYDLETGAWSPLGSGGGNGVNEVVLDMTAIGTDLYVGGGFTAANIGGLAIPAGYVARFDTLTGQWSAPGRSSGAGVDDAVYAMTSIGTTLYVGGGFSTVSDGGTTITVNRLARYETTSKIWERVGSGTGNGANEFIFALAAMGSDLYLGGIFTAVNDGGATVTTNGLARFNTTTGAWSSLGTGGGNGVDEMVSSLAVLGTDLYVGGIFSKVNVGGVTVTARNIARFNTLNSTWSALGSGGGNGVEDTGVSALTVLGTDLYVGGYFKSVNTGGPLVLANRVAKYSPSTSTWSGLLDLGGGNGLDYNVYALLGVENSLFVGGGFSTAGDDRISTNIARYCPNSLPAITAATQTVKQGSSSSRLQIAVVSDPNQSAETLTATAIAETGSGIGLSSIAIDAAGNVTAAIQSSCLATSSTFTITVIDSFNVRATGTLAINVVPNTPPALVYGSRTVGVGVTMNLNPVSPPQDNGQITGFSLQSQGTFTGAISVNGDGVLSITNAGPPGQHSIIVRAVDNCGQVTDATLQLTVVTSAIQITALLPDRLIAGSGATVITVSGSGFNSGSVLQLNGSNRPTTIVDTGRLTATLSAADLASPGVLSLAVRDGSGLTSNSLNLPVYPRVTSTTATGYAIGEIAPDSIAAAFGPQLARGVELSATLPLPTNLIGTRVSVRDSAGITRDQPLFFVAPQQVNYLLHPQTAYGAATVTVYIDSTIVALGEIQVGRISPGLFTQNSTGEGVPAAYALRVAGGNVTTVPIMRYDQSQTKWLPVPIDPGAPTDEIYLVLFGSGLRGGGGVAGVTATLGGRPLPVLYLGGDSTYVGLDQLNLGPLPRSLAGAGEVSLVVTIDGQPVNPGKSILLNIK